MMWIVASRQHDSLEWTPRALSFSAAGAHDEAGRLKELDLMSGWEPAAWLIIPTQNTAPSMEWQHVHCALLRCPLPDNP